MNLWPLTSSWPHTSILDFLLLHYPSGSCISSFCLFCGSGLLCGHHPLCLLSSGRSLCWCLIFHNAGLSLGSLAVIVVCSHTHVPVHRRIFMLCFFFLFVLHFPLCFFLPQLQILKCLVFLFLFVFCKAGFVFLLLVAPVSHFLTVNVSIWAPLSFVLDLWWPQAVRELPGLHVLQNHVFENVLNVSDRSLQRTFLTCFPGKSKKKKSLFWLRISYCICAEFPLCICFYLTGKESLVNQ